ncbi:MAG: hypothetical protein OEZ06_11610 [Myxococcales bacterium]|nr:hypothetical protein [Myxococcales bacterium]
MIVWLAATSAILAAAFTRFDRSRRRSVVRSAPPGVLLLALAGPLGLGCGGADRHVILGGHRAPSTSGIIELDELDGGNTLVSIHMEHLHPPTRLADDLKVFVVWFEPPQGAPIRAGKLSYDPEARTGDLAETAPARALVVKITAERDEAASKPSEFLIASQSVSVD